MLERFKQVDAIQKQQDTDPEFMKLVAKSKIVPTRFDSTFTEKMFLFQKLEDQSPTKNLKKLEKDQAERNQSVISQEPGHDIGAFKNEYYRNLQECHKAIHDHNKNKNLKPQKKVVEKLDKL